MNILQVNIRASQGGAGRVALDLHRRLRADGVESRLAYGYGSGIQDDPNVAADQGVVRLATKASVLGNYATHRLIGRDVFTPGKERLRSEIAAADIVHVHVPHHYFLNWWTFLGLVRAAGKPILATVHDWWFVTGRCGFIEQCSGWKRACGECGAMLKRDLPAWIDLSRRHKAAKVRSIRELGAGFRFVCPSQHIADDYRLIYPDTAIEVIPNCVDLEFEALLDDLPVGADRAGYVVSASDLTTPGKVDHALVERLLAAPGVELRLVGRNNPFQAPPAAILGEIRDRRVMAGTLAAARGLLFCSTMDNAPLTIIEALTAGCFVIAYESPAAHEMLKLVGGRCVSGREEMFDIVTKGEERSLYGGIGPEDLAARARAHFGGAPTLRKYRHIYEMATHTGG